VDDTGMPLGLQFQEAFMQDIRGLTPVIRGIETLTPQNMPALTMLFSSN
jgi:hypothetical protein